MLRRGVQATRISTRFNHHFNYVPNAKKAEAFKSFEQHSEQHAQGTTALWRNISLACIPMLIACAWYVYPREVHHIKHLEELNQLPDDQWPPEMDYQNIRTRRFFWGDGQHSLFWGTTNHRKEN